MIARVLTVASLLLSFGLLAAPGPAVAAGWGPGGNPAHGNPNEAAALNVIYASQIGAYAGDTSICSYFNAAGQTAFVTASIATTSSHGLPDPVTCVEAVTAIGHLSAGLITPADVIAALDTGSITMQGSTAQFAIPGRLTVGLSKQPGGSWLISSYRLS